MAHGGMGYAQEYHVERYLRECFVPRIAPVSRVGALMFQNTAYQLTLCLQEMIMSYVAEKVLNLPRSY